MLVSYSCYMDAGIAASSFEQKPETVEQMLIRKLDLLWQQVLVRDSVY